MCFILHVLYLLARAQSQYRHDWLQISTSCCSTDCDRPHRRCHLANNFCSPGYSIYFTIGREMPPKLPLPLKDASPHLIDGSLGLSESMPQTASRLVHPFQHRSWLWPTDRETHRQTQRPRYMYNNRPHDCTPCVRCGLIMTGRSLLTQKCDKNGREN